MRNAETSPDLEALAVATASLLAFVAVEAAGPRLPAASGLLWGVVAAFAASTVCSAISFAGRMRTSPGLGCLPLAVNALTVALLHGWR